MSLSNTTQYAILGLLTIQPMSGYDLGKHLRESLHFFWAESNGQIYPTLKKLVADGWITPSATRQSGKRVRQRYTLTPVGRDQLSEWLAAPPQIQSPRNELILKLFLGRSAPNGALIRHVAACKQRHEASLDVFMRLRECITKENTRSPDLEYWLLCLQHGIRLQQAEVDWCVEALATLATVPKRIGKQPAAGRK